MSPHWWLVEVKRFGETQYIGRVQATEAEIQHALGPYLTLMGEANMSQQVIKGYAVWKSHTCYVCSGGTGIPTWHASIKGYHPTSPCDTVQRVVRAFSRKQAIRLYHLGVRA